MSGLKAILGGLLLATMAAFLSACVAGVAYGPSVVVGSLALPPGGTGQVVISVFGLNDLQGLQVGPQGRFTFDQKVVQLKAIEGLNGFVVFASKIDNAGGWASFLVAFPGGSRGEDGVVQLELEAVGTLGSSSTLAITSIDVLADSRGNDITNYEIINGRAIISPGIGP
ncbi:MAG: hypothetical protein NUW06_04425 [Candidatus Acetothermia bacterium]|jgi:hypothetical protein|nr:hypothetical protein [Candidatus Acetothermia bacterium]MDH7505294.1 hypothetical protein [Candidatus Acetothermia bacterium]